MWFTHVRGLIIERKGYGMKQHLHGTQISTSEAKRDNQFENPMSGSWDRLLNARWTVCACVFVCLPRSTDTNPPAAIDGGVILEYQLIKIQLLFWFGLYDLENI